MFVTELTKAMRLAGMFEPNRRTMLRLACLHAMDDLFRWCSSLVSSKVFQRPGTMGSVKRKGNKKSKKKKKNKQKAQKRKKPDSDDDEEEEEHVDPISREWNVALPQLLVAAEACGFGVATSKKAWKEALLQIAAREVSRGLEVVSVPTALEDGDDTTLHFVDLSMVRVFYAPGPRWAMALPVVVHINDPNNDNVDSSKLSLYCSGAMPNDSSKDWEWFIFEEEDVYVFTIDPNDLPDLQTKQPRSKIQRLLVERAREQINNSAMTGVNLQNMAPPIPFERKDDGKDHEKQSSDENDYRRNEPNTSVMEDDSGKDCIRAPAAPIPNTPSAWNRHLDFGLRAQQEAEEEDKKNTDWSVCGLFYDPEGDNMLTGNMHLRNRLMQMPTGYTISKTPLPEPPSYYNEQRAHRKFAAAAVFGIPMGILFNYSIMAPASEKAGGLSVMGNKSSGLGGATSSTQSTAWTAWETATNALKQKLEQWSQDVCSKMGRHAAQQRLEKHMNDADSRFHQEHGTEDGLFGSRGELNTAALDQYRRQKQLYRAEAGAAFLQEEADNAVMFRIPRVHPLETIKSLHVEGILKSEIVISEIAKQLEWPLDFFEDSASIDKTRDARNNPPIKTESKKVKKKAE